jgi:hypothetical protein
VEFRQDGLEDATDLCGAWSVSMAITRSSGRQANYSLNGLAFAPTGEPETDAADNGDYVRATIILDLFSDS